MNHLKWATRTIPKDSHAPSPLVNSSEAYVIEDNAATITEDAINQDVVVLKGYGQEIARRLNAEVN